MLYFCEYLHFKFKLHSELCPTLTLNDNKRTTEKRKDSTEARKKSKTMINWGIQTWKNRIFI